jgi:Tol biopolymer transport system component
LISSGGAEMDNVPFWMVSTPTGSARRMDEVLGHDAVWEPGGALVFVNGKDLYIAEHDGANPRKLVEAQGPPFSLRFSPDGSRLRFTIGDPNSRSTMWQVRADGSGMVPVLPLPGWKAAPAPCCGTWTPNGKYFVFVVAGDIWVVADRPGKYFEPVQLTSGPLRYGGLVPSIDGKGLFAIGVQPKAELVHYDAPSGQFVPFLGGISAGDVDFSRDGQWVAYVTYPDGSLWRSKVDGSEPLPLISAPMQAASAHWSPDGMRIAFSGHRHREPWKVWLVSKDGGSPEPLTPGNAAEADPTWSPDGKSLAFVRFTRPPHIVLLDVSSHGRSELTRPEGLWRPRWSPDGRFLAAVSADSKFLMICDLNTHRWRRLAGSVGTIGMPAWSEDGVFIFFDDNSTHDSKYLRVRVSDGKIEQLASLRTVRRYLGNWGFWSGLTPGNALLLSRDASKSEVYKFDWRLP